MSRSIPKDKTGKPIIPELTLNPAQPPALLHRKGGDVVLETQVREYELLTPLMGGGVNAKENDPVTIVRGNSIRGQLRFWWRACRAGLFANIRDLKKREDEVWGSTEIASPILIEITDKRGKEEVAFKMAKHPYKHDRLEIQPSKEIAAYAAFPLLPDKDEQKDANWESERVTVAVNFTLTLRYPKDKQLMDDLNAALWAWETFGGIGSRTRRGFGAIRLLKKCGKTVDPWPGDPDKLADELRKQLKTMAPSGVQHPQIPQLHDAVAMQFTKVRGGASSRESARAAWQTLIQKLREFRQSRFKDEFGQSKWPEANAIRLRAGKKIRFSQNVPTHYQKFINKFPRAVFGLPLLFHFPPSHDPGIGEVTLRGANDPNDKNKKRERLASPLILRPLVCENGAVGMAMVLNTPQIPPDGLLLDGKAKNAPLPIAQLGVDQQQGFDEAMAIEPLKGNPNVLDAFLQRIKNS